ncbi:unnamed protein product, partial [Mesorhabditis belari]|uniref:Enoyl-CoA hydratase n=1 Tax=Mesorhabditis belari TaxID=2138241 RepID=A0AAF3FB11_9BILA
MSIVIEKRGPITCIKIDNVKRKNALTDEMYTQLFQALDAADDDEDTFITVVTGCGDEFYSSGNDFTPGSLPTPDPDDRDYQAGFKLLTNRLIRHKKALIALVNGPAIGIACTTLTLFDHVIMSDKAYLLCPFTQFGLCPEGTSSYTFEKIMGRAKAGSMALFAERMTAQEAYQCGIASMLIPHEKFRQETEKLLEKYSKLSKSSVLASKALMRPREAQDKLLAVNQREDDLLKQLFVSEETIERLMQRFAPKSKI